MCLCSRAEHDGAGVWGGRGAATGVRADGTYLREIGHNLYAWSFAHAVRVDKDDNIWAMDKGSDMVIRFDPAGRVTMVFGRKQEASDEGIEALKHPKPPLPPVDGQFPAGDGCDVGRGGQCVHQRWYINSRVAKVDKNGKWLKSFGEPGSGPGQLNTPHSIAADAAGNIYVADRGNRRIQVFDGDGKVLRQITIDVPFDYASATAALEEAKRRTRRGRRVRAPWAVCITPKVPGGPEQVLYASDSFPGRIYKLSLDGKVLGCWARRVRQLKQFGWIHEIACPSENVAVCGGAAELAGAEAGAESRGSRVAVTLYPSFQCSRSVPPLHPTSLKSSPSSANLLSTSANRRCPRTEADLLRDGFGPTPRSNASSPTLRAGTIQPAGFALTSQLLHLAGHHGPT